MGLGPQTPAAQPSVEAGAFCPPRWTAEDDPRAAEAAEARAELGGDLPEGARPLLPDRSARLSRGCALRLPVDIEPGRCVLFGAQVLATSGRPSAVVRVPSPHHDGSDEHHIDHGMAVTLGEAGDPVCYDDRFHAAVELAVDGVADLAWIQAWSVSPEAASTWAAGRRRALAAGHGSPDAVAGEAMAIDAALPEIGRDGGAAGPVLLDGGPLRDGGMPELADAGPPAAAGTTTPDGGLDGALPALDGGAPADVALLPEPVPPPPEPPPPLGPLAEEQAADCDNGFDDDGDGRADCEDPDCAPGCASTRQDRLSWLRLLDVRIGVAGRISHAPEGGGLQPFEATGSLDDAYDPVAMRWGLDAAASAIWRPSRYLGVGLDLGLATSSLRAFPPEPRPRDSELRATALALSLGLGLHLSVPVWIMEVGGTVGLGWLMISTSGEVRSLSGDDTSWGEDPDATSTSHHPYAMGLIWVDFWVIDALALGLYGGVLAPLSEAPDVPATDYHAGLRTTLRFDLR